MTDITSSPQPPPPPGPPTPTPTLPDRTQPPPPAAPAEPWPPPDATIVAYDVSKSFGGLVAVSNISLAIQPGVTALLGPNGAGKSTLLRLLSGQANPSSGRIWVAGGNPRRDPDTRARIGLVPQQDGVFERETALDVVRLAAVLSGLDHPVDRARQALEVTEMDPDLPRGIGTFSKGMRQRVKIAQALVHDPLVLMMDEPLNGLDPRQRRNMTELVHRLGDAGKTILISSHVLDEVERFGSHVVVIAHGRLAAQGDFRGIRRLMEDQPMRIRIVADDIRSLTAALLHSGAIAGCTLHSEHQAEVTTRTTTMFRRHLPHYARELGQRLSEVTPLDDDLESVFRYLVGGRE